MKKTLYCILAAVLLLALAFTAGVSEGFESEEPKTFTNVSSGEKFENAEPLKIGVFYHSDSSHGFRREWVFTPQESGTCMVYIRSYTEPSSAVDVNITNQYGEDLIKRVTIPSKSMSPTIIPVDVTAGKEYHIRWHGYAGKFNVALAVCTPSHHVGPTNAMTVLEEATCTQPGTKAQCCALCGGSVNTVTIPAAGHKTGRETVFVEPTCISTGLKGTQCEVCGERVTEVTMPMTSHTPGAWEDYRQATCTEEGTRVQRCAYCGETLKTETVPASGHKFAGWSTDGNGQQSRTCAVCGYTEYK